MTRTGKGYPPSPEPDGEKGTWCGEEQGKHHWWTERCGDDGQSDGTHGLDADSDWDSGGRGETGEGTGDEGED